MTVAQRGGARPGSGPKPKMGPASPADETPLQYLLRRMRDDSVPAVQRDKLAIAAARYTSPPPDRVYPIGKKEAAERYARTVHRDTDWGPLLSEPDAADNDARWSDLLDRKPKN